MIFPVGLAADVGTGMGEFELVAMHRRQRLGRGGEQLDYTAAVVTQFRRCIRDTDETCGAKNGKRTIRELKVEPTTDSDHDVRLHGLVDGNRVGGEPRM